MGDSNMMNRRYHNSVRVSETWNDIHDALSAGPCRQLLLSLMDADSGESVSLPESAANPTAPPGPEFEKIEAVFNALFSSADDLPDSIVIGWQHLEEERELDNES